ncbi:hypothetical protein JW756_04010 [Candidatus Woesearchaeota archaeon]|nr:hypothetical protein [Candidatus Woesearchaeota archaeon]
MANDEGLSARVKEAYEKLPDGGKSVAKGLGVAALGGVAGILLPVFTLGSGFVIAGVGYAGVKLYQAYNKTYNNKE